MRVNDKEGKGLAIEMQALMTRQFYVIGGNGGTGADLALVIFFQQVFYGIGDLLRLLDARSW